MVAQGAVAAIRTGCQMLSEGKADLDKFKKTVEGGAKDAKAIFKEATGLWGWLKGLFSSAEQPIASVESAPVVKPKQKVKQAELTYEEFQAQSVHEICEQMKIYFEAIRALQAHCRELEHESATTDKVASAAIDRIEIEWQLKQLSTQVREAMTYTPEHLGLQDLYARFTRMYEQILEEQEFARAVKAKKERDTAWQHEYRQEILKAKLVYAIAMLFALLEMIGLYLTL
jgi:phage host-nuclease inhibitor protein Gam